MSHGFHGYVEQRVNYRVIYYPLWIIPTTGRAWSTLNNHIRGLQGGWQHHGGQQQPGDRWSCYGALGQVGIFNDFQVVARWSQFLVGKSPHVLLRHRQLPWSTGMPCPKRWRIPSAIFGLPFFGERNRPAPSAGAQAFGGQEVGFAHPGAFP